jgi:hypothetical protein
MAKSNGYKNGKPDVGYWLEQIRYGLEYRKNSAFEQNWDTWRQYYRGNWRSDILPTNIFFKMIRSTVPRIYFRNPAISVSPATQGAEGAVFAKILERTDNKLLRSMKIKKQMKRLVQDAWMFGTAVGKKGFGSQYQATPQAFGDTGPVDAASIEARLSNFVEYNYDIMPNMPWFLRNSPANFVLPAGLDYFEDARWSCFIIERDVADIQDDPRLKNTKDMGAGSISEMVGGSRRTITKKTDVTQLYEIRDKKTGTVFVISPHAGGKVHLFEGDEFARLRINVPSILVFNDDDERVWGVPDAKILDPLQREGNEIKTYKMYHRRMSIVRVLAKIGAISETEAAKLVGPDVNPIIWTQENTDNAVKIIESGDIPAGLMKADVDLLGEIRETLGFSRNEMGEFKEGSRSPTALETRVVKQASDIRVDERRDMIADMLVETVQDFHPIIFDHWTGEQVEEIVGPGGVPFWIHFQPKMLSKINYIVKADPDQSLPETRDVRENRALMLYQQLKSNPLIDPFKLTSYLLRELHGVQFDDMIRGIPDGMGSMPSKPISVEQFQQIVQQVAQQMPQLLLGPQVPAGAQQ